MSVTDRIRDVIIGESRSLDIVSPSRGRNVEIRDPSGATLQTSTYTNLGKPMVPVWNAEDAVRLAYYANVIVYRAVFQCAMAISGLPFRAGKDPEKPDKFVTTAPLARLLSPPPGGPAPHVSARRLWAWTVTQYLITGKWAWEIECESPKGKGQIVNLWPLVSCALEALPTKSGNDYFTGYSYGKPGTTGNERRPLTPDQVFYGWRPMADDYRQPESPLQAARLGVSVAVMQDRYDFAFLRNDARPAAIVVHEAFATKQEGEAFKRAFRGDFRGPDNAGKTMFLEALGDTEHGVMGSIDIKVLGMSQRDGQFMQRYEQKINDICVALGTPLSILGDSSKRTYDAANVEHRNWWENTLQPLCFELADEANMQLAPRLGNELGWFDFSRVKALQSDNKLLTLGATLPMLVGAGKPIASTELRDALELPTTRPPDMPGETATPAPTGAVASTEPPTGVDDGSPGKAPDTGMKPAPAPTGTPDITPPGPGRQPGAGREAATETRERTRETRLTEWRKVDASVRAFEPIFEEAMQTIFEKQERSVLAKLRDRRGARAKGDDAASRLFDQEYWSQEIAKVMGPHYGTVFARAGEAVEAKFGVSFSVKDPLAREFIDKRANQLAGQVNETTYESIKSVMVDGAANGASIPDIAKSIKGVFDEATTNRATTIARTEVISAYNGSTVTMGMAMPDDVCAGQEWIATDDDRTRAAHLDADGQQISTSDSFDVDGEPLAYPGDPSGSPENVINCRCTVGLLTPDEYGGGSRDASHTIEPFEARNLEAMREEAYWGELEGVPA
jgi:hypothetical protein